MLAVAPLSKGAATLFHYPASEEDSPPWQVELQLRRFKYVIMQHRVKPFKPYMLQTGRVCGDGDQFVKIFHIFFCL